ncbi:hypothetical protein MXB_2427, partial [Myxobolus squamalis]
MGVSPSKSTSHLLPLG